MAELENSLDEGWEAIFTKYGLHNFDFDKEVFIITARQMKDATANCTRTSAREVRTLNYQPIRAKRPAVFKKHNLFLLPQENAKYIVIKGEGYVDIPEIKTPPVDYPSKLIFKPDTVFIGNSEMQHLDYAYAASILRDFMNDPTLVLTIRGRKYATSGFSFNVGNKNIHASGFQMEVDAGYEGQNRLVLVEAKNAHATNTIIRQLYFPYRFWSENTNKKVHTLFFEKRGSEYYLWEFNFRDKYDYNSIYLVRSKIYRLLD